MAGDHAAAIRNGIQIALTPVPGGVHADREPEAAGAAQSEAKKQTDQPGAERANPGLAGILQMHGPKDERQHIRGWPESKTPGKRELSVAAKGELLEEANQQEERSPEDCEFDGPFAMQNGIAVRKHSRAAHQKHQNRKRDDAPRQPLPEWFAESSTPRKTVGAKRPFFHCAHDPGRKKRRNNQHDINEEGLPQRPGAARRNKAYKTRQQKEQHHYHAEVQEQAPARPQTPGAKKEVVHSIGGRSRQRRQGRVGLGFWRSQQWSVAAAFWLKHAEVSLTVPGHGKTLA